MHEPRWAGIFREGLRRLPGLFLTLLTAWGVIRSMQDAGEGILYVSSVLWVLYGILSAVVYSVTRLPHSVVNFLTGIGVAPVTTGFSAIEAMALRGRHAEAAEAYLLRSRDRAVGCEAMLRRATLLAGPLGQPAVAARELERFRERSRLLSPSDDLWIGRALIDLYDGPLDDPGRAMVELRRLLDRYPDSPQVPVLHRMLHTLRDARFGPSPSSPTGAP